jgi:hypothetical protein
MTWVTALLLLLLATAGYLAWVWVPVWVTHFEVKQVVRDYGNQAVKNSNDAELVQNMLHKLQVLEQKVEVGGDGRTERVAVVRVALEDVVWERNNRTATLHVAFEYARDVHYPIIDRSTEAAFQIDLTMDIGRPDWGPAR